MKHRPRTGQHAAPLQPHSTRPDWGKLRPHRPTLRRARAVLHARFTGWQLPDGVRLL